MKLELNLESFEPQRMQAMCKPLQPQGLLTDLDPSIMLKSLYVVWHMFERFRCLVPESFSQMYIIPKISICICLALFNVNKIVINHKSLTSAIPMSACNIIASRHT